MAKIIGINDEQTSCDCCGREDLKKTVIVQFEDSDAVQRYGVVCASKMLGRSADDLRKEANKAQRLLISSARIAARAEYAQCEARLAFVSAIEYANNNRSEFPDYRARIDYLAPFSAADYAMSQQIKTKYNVSFF